MPAPGSHLLLRALCEELARCGTRHACTSPGSRSTPIVLALAREPGLRASSHVDERCAAFFALGLAKADGRPAVLACTSGTAAANYAPAVIEAHHARVPMIVLTADRPPELRDNGAGQAIDQLKLYGDAVRWFVEVGVEEPTPGNLRWIRELACRAYAEATGPRPGPVHLNFPLREPLVPDGPLGPDPVPGRADGRPWVKITRDGAGALARAARTVPARTVIVAGRQEDQPSSGPATAAAAHRLGLPLLADPLSDARRGPAAIATYDLLLRDSRFTDAARPELVVRLGDLPTSKPLRAWLQDLDGVEQVAIDPQGAWQDPAGVLTETVVAHPVTILDGWATGRSDTGESWLDVWRDADTRIAEAIDAELGDALSEPLIARRLGDWLGPETALVVGSSMPIRDVELYLGRGESLPRVLANRGANGIDGTVSTALGVAAARADPTVLLIGDVALAHDLGGLLAARRLGLALTIVLINNDGGGIFSFLPVASQDDIFTEHIATPHGLDFAHAAALYGCGYTLAADPAALEHAIGAATAQQGATTIIEVRTDRAANLALHRRVAARALAALSR